MNEHPQDLKPRTKAFALRVIRMYSELPKNDTSRRSSASRFFVREPQLARITARRPEAGPRPSSFPRWAIVSRKLNKPSIGSNSSWIVAVFPRQEWPSFSTKIGNSSPFSRQLTKMRGSDGKANRRWVSAFSVQPSPFAFSVRTSAFSIVFEASMGDWANSYTWRNGILRAKGGAWKSRNLESRRQKTKFSKMGKELV